MTSGGKKKPNGLKPMSAICFENGYFQHIKRKKNHDPPPYPLKNEKKFYEKN